jgi:hypothetical protein
MITSFGVAVLAGLLGLAFLLVGYRFFMALLPIWGFFAGFWLGAMATTWILGTGFLATVAGWVVAFVVGLIAAVLSYLFYLVGVAIVAAAIGAALGSGVMTAIGFQPGLMVTIVAIVSALVAAGLTLLLNIQKYVIIVFASIGGASFLVISALLLLGQITLADLQGGGNLMGPIFASSFLWWLVWAAVAVVGVVFQIRTTRYLPMPQVGSGEGEQA